MSDVDINSMSFKQLKGEVQELRDTVTRMKRMYEDVLYNLDDDNFGTRFLQEKNGMKAELKVTANAITSVVEDVDDIEQEVSEISQTAGKISSIVSKNISAYFVKNVMPTKSNTIDEEKSMLCKYDDIYYYYSDVDEEWEEYPASGLQTMFVQTANGFALTGDVSISGDLITSGTISGDRITSGTITGATVQADPNYYNDNVRLASNSPAFEVVFGGTTIGKWVPVLGGSTIYPTGNGFLEIQDVTASGTWNFTGANVVGLSSTVAVFG